MWCDDYGLDLLKLVPGASAALAPVVAVELVTHGRVTGGALDGAAFWTVDGRRTAFFGLSGPSKPSHLDTSLPVVRCSAVQAIRDAWGNFYDLWVDGSLVFAPAEMGTEFQVLFERARGWKTASPNDAIAAWRAVLVRIKCAVDIIRRRAVANRPRPVAAPDAASRRETRQVSPIGGSLASIGPFAPRKIG